MSNGYIGDATAAIVAQMERFAPGFRDRVISQTVSTTTQFAAHKPNFVGGDIITAPGFSPVGIRPANHAVAVSYWCTGYVYLLGRHAARARRTRYVRRPRRTNLETSALEGKPYNLGRETDATQWSFGQSDVSMRITPRSQALSARRGQAAVDGRSPWPRRQASRT